MACKFFARAIGKNLLIRLLTVAALCAATTGCPNPKMKLFFGEERKSSLTFHRLDDQVKVRLSSFTDRPCGKYDVSLTLKVTYKLDQSDFQYRPEEVRVVVSDSTMRFGRERSVYSSDDTARYTVNQYRPNEITFGLHFQTTVDPAVVPEEGGLLLRIILNDFISYKGAPLHFDTIQATELKRCDY